MKSPSEDQDAFCFYQSCIPRKIQTTYSDRLSRITRTNCSSLTAMSIVPAFSFLNDTLCARLQCPQQDRSESVENLKVQTDTFGSN
ncbi:hypothetical protein RvY_12854 [Ramazzottius varieornatus]|uniref:Uncharacterized protein n=1 Tax=Ramazzottius varieornatus TaxID=947166 RepID=A0A1D1VQ06_RAMVA|nr:hypothetical protein RvY_12854 [Ramazzottius varieornatus]